MERAGPPSRKLSSSVALDSSSAARPPLENRTDGYTVPYHKFASMDRASDTASRLQSNSIQSAVNGNAASSHNLPQKFETAMGSTRNNNYPRHQYDLSLPVLSASPLVKDARSRLTRARLLADLPRLPRDIQAQVAIILNGSLQIWTKPSDVYEQEAGFRWWKVAPDGTKQLYRECYELCVKDKRYYRLAPFDVQEMVDTIQAGSRALRERAAKVSIAATLVEQHAAIENGKAIWRIPPDDVQMPNDRLFGGLSLHRWTVTPTAASIVGDSAGGMDVEQDMTTGPGLAKTYSRWDRSIGTTMSGSESMRQNNMSSNPSEYGRIVYVDVEDELPKKRAKLTERADVSSQGETQAKADMKSRAPTKEGNLDPGVKHFKWPPARVRIYREHLGVMNDNDLPAPAFSDVVHELESNCTPGPVDIRKLNFVLSVEEILTYFPNHSIWREICWRIMKHWSASRVVAFIYWTRNLMNKKSIKRDTLQKRYEQASIWAGIPRKAKKDKKGNIKEVKAPNPSKLSALRDPAVKGNLNTVSIVNGLTGCDAVEPFDYLVYDLAAGVVQGRHPTGKGAQLLTHVIRHVREVTGDRDLRLSQVEEYARTHKIIVPINDRLGTDIAVEDLAALNREGARVMKSYRDRFGSMP